MDYNALASLSCCECGVPISYNLFNMCGQCITKKEDSLKSIPKSVIINHCFACSRFLSPPSYWIPAHNTDALLNACLKLIKGLSQYKIKDARFLWTEPHSKRLKVHIVIHQDLENIGSLHIDNQALERTFDVEFVMHSHLCESCTREAAKDYWNANVQVRQKAVHKKTLFYMEQIIIKFQAHKDCTNVKKVAGGIDFFFGSKSNAATFVQFLRNHLPIRVEESKKLKSQDDSNNTYNYKYTYSVEIPSVCKDDLVCLPKKFAQHLGNLSQLCLVLRITDQIHLIDPLTAKTRHIDSVVYFNNPFSAIATTKNLSEFYVVDTELCPPQKQKPGDCPVSKNHLLADTYVMRSSEMTDEIHVRTYLGKITRPGDNFLGYDMRCLNCNNDILDEISSDKIPDVILVKKYYDNKQRRRNWKLPRLDDNLTNESEFDDEATKIELADDIEGDEELWSTVNVVTDGNQVVPLEQLMANLNVCNDVEMANDD